MKGFFFEKDFFFKEVTQTVKGFIKVSSDRARSLNIHVRTCQLQPEGRNARGEARLRGPEVLGPLRGLGIRPLVSAIRGLGNPLPGPLRAPERLPEAPERRFRGSGKTRWATQRPLRGPIFPDAP